MTDRHHPRRHGSMPDRSSPARVVASPVAMPIRTGNPQESLCRDRRIDRDASRGECRAHPVTGVLEQPPAVTLKSPTATRRHEPPTHTHRVGIRLPSTRRTFDVREQKRHRPRRSRDTAHLGTANSDRMSSIWAWA